MNSAFKADMSGRIALTGLGPVSSLGIGNDSVWQNLRDCRNKLGRVSQNICGESWDDYPIAEVPYFEGADFGFSDDRLRFITGQRNNRDLSLLAIAARLSLQDSGLIAEHGPEHCGMVLAHENPGVDEYTRQIWTALEERTSGSSESLLGNVKEIYARVEAAGYGTHSFVLLQQIARLMDIHGPVLAVNNACASGLFALETAAQWIRCGHAKTMVVVGGDSPRLITRYLWLKAANACCPDGVMRPFDRDRTGFILGEGAGAIVIEDYGSACERGVRIYAEYLGGAFHCDAWKLSVPCVSPHLYQRAIEEALERTSTAVADIDLLVPHGAASPVHDRYEADAITSVFGTDPARPLITALKPYIGHTLAGSSLLETIVALLGIIHDTVPVTPNWNTPDPKVAVRPVTHHRPAKIKTWMKTATGFGGFNAACVFSQPGARA